MTLIWTAMIHTPLRLLLCHIPGNRNILVRFSLVPDHLHGLFIQIFLDKSRFIPKILVDRADLVGPLIILVKLSKNPGPRAFFAAAGLLPLLIDGPELLA
jgi:hypothetical protein